MPRHCFLPFWAAHASPSPPNESPPGSLILETHPSLQTTRLWRQTVHHRDSKLGAHIDTFQGPRASISSPVLNASNTSSICIRLQQPLHRFTNFQQQPTPINTSLKAQIPGHRPKVQPPDPNSSLEAQITTALVTILWGCCPSNHFTPTYTHIRAKGTTCYLMLLRL